MVNCTVVSKSSLRFCDRWIYLHTLLCVLAVLAWRTHYTHPHTHTYTQRCIYIFVWLWHSLMVYFGDHVNKSFKYVIDWNIVHFHSVSRMSECFSFIMSWGLRSGMAKEPGRAVLPLPERPAWTTSAPVVVSSSDPISICCKQSCFRFQKNVWLFLRWLC